VIHVRAGRTPLGGHPIREAGALAGAAVPSGQERELAARKARDDERERESRQREHRIMRQVVQPHEDDVGAHAVKRAEKKRDGEQAQVREPAFGRGPQEGKRPPQRVSVTDSIPHLVTPALLARHA